MPRDRDHCSGHIHPPHFQSLMSMTSEAKEAKIPLPTFIKMLASNNLPVPRAMALAGKMYTIHGVTIDRIERADERGHVQIQDVQHALRVCAADGREADRTWRGRQGRSEARARRASQGGLRDWAEEEVSGGGGCRRGGPI